MESYKNQFSYSKYLKQIKLQTCVEGNLCATTDWLVTGGCACTGDACACVTAAAGVAVAGGAVSWATGAALNWFTPGGIRPGLNPPGPGIPTTNGNRLR